VTDWRVLLAPTALERAHLGNHEKEAMMILFIDFDDEIFESDSNLTLYLYFLSC
jgi:hypothetical protein